MELTSSADFANVSVSGAASFPASGAAPTSSAAASTAVLHYDLRSKSYTLTVSGRSQTFSPADLSAADSTPQLAVYIRKNGSTTDSLTLTKPGESGPVTYKYVGGAYWQRTVEGGATISGSLDAVAYGLPTTDTALPRTGTADYAVDLIGVEATFGGIVGIAGSGATQVDFAKGVLVTHGKVTTTTGPSSAPGGGVFSSEARLSKDSNSFAGTFRYDDFGLFIGQVNGKFYGPNAQEIGASFFGASGSQRVVVGTIIGRGGSVTRSNTSVKTPTVSEFFAAESGMLKASGTPRNNINGPGFTNTSSAANAVIVHYDEASKAYTLISPDQSQYFLGGVNIGITSESLTNTTPTIKDLKSVATMEWLKSVGGDNTLQRLVYGVMTPNSAVPRTGTGDYLIGASGRAADGDYVNFMDFSGTGFLNVNFATGTLTTEGRLSYLEDYVISGQRPRGRATGTFSGNAQLSSTSNSFTGPVSLTGVGEYSGAMTGHFYGATGEEVGASFNATDGKGGVLAGTFAGALDPAASQAVTTLGNMTTPTTLTFSATTTYLTGVSYDPASSTYTLSVAQPGLFNAPVYTGSLNASTRNAALSNASYDSHSVTMDSLPYNVLMLKPVASNPTLALTYASLVQLLQTTSSDPNPLVPKWREYAAFGLPTAQLRMPIGGTATYNGVAVGSGSVQTNAFSGGSPPSVTNFYDLTGTTIMTANFATASFSSSLNMTGADITSGATRTFAPWSFNGTIESNRFTTHNNGATYQGRFYGPNAPEIGGVFDYFQTDAQGTLMDFEGAFVGKR